MLEVDVIIDTRENSKHPEFKSILDEKGVKTSVEMLNAGDFLIFGNEEGKGCLIERKEISDFISSMVSGRIFEQLEKLKSADARPLILVEGSFAQARKYSKVNSSSILGCISNIVLKWGVPVITLPSKKWTPYFILAVSTCLGKEKQPYALRGGAPRKLSLREKQIYLLQGLPSVGPKTSEALLEYFGTPITLFGNLQDLKKVKGIGDKTAREIEEVVMGG